MCHTHKYKSADDNVKHRIARNEYQDPLCVCCQPDVVLANEKLEEKKKCLKAFTINIFAYIKITYYYYCIKQNNIFQVRYLELNNVL